MGKRNDGKVIKTGLKDKKVSQNQEANIYFTFRARTKQKKLLFECLLLKLLTPDDKSCM